MNTLKTHVSKPAAAFTRIVAAMALLSGLAFLSVPAEAQSTAAPRTEIVKQLGDAVESDRGVGRGVGTGCRRRSASATGSRSCPPVPTPRPTPRSDSTASARSRPITSDSRPAG